MDYFLTMEYNISTTRLLIVLILTFSMFILVIKQFDSALKKVFLGFFFISFFFYSGFGISILKNYFEYSLYYFLYLLVLSFSLISFAKSTIKIKINKKTTTIFFSKYGPTIIFLFIFLHLLYLIYPENNILNLINPPTIDNSNLFYSEKPSDSTVFFSKLIKVFINLLYPFYIISLLSYSKKPIKLLIFIVLPVYIGFCAFSYIGRSSIVLNFIFYISILYFYYEQYRVKITFFAIIGLLSSLPILTYLFFMRNGQEVSLLNTFDVLDPIVRIEFTFPFWFNTIMINSEKGITYVSEYLVYIFTQPIPGFLKQWAIGDFQVNYSIAEVLLGVKPTDQTFFVPLTGIVTESIFIFGKYFFWLHAVLLGFILNLFINFLMSNDNFKILVIYAIVFTSSIAGRAGTTAEMFFPFIIKSMVYLPIVLVAYSLLQSPSKSKLNYKQ